VIAHIFQPEVFFLNSDTEKFYKVNSKTWWILLGNFKNNRGVTSL